MARSSYKGMGKIIKPKKNEKITIGIHSRGKSTIIQSADDHRPGSRKICKLNFGYIYRLNTSVRHTSKGTSNNILTI